MSVYSPLSFANSSQSMPKAAGATFAANGQFLIGDVVNAQFGVKPCAGAAGEKFVGVLNAQTSAAPFLQTTSVMAEEVTLSVGGTVTLSRTPLGGTTGAYNITDGAAIAGGAFSVSGTTFTSVANAGKKVRIVYKYTLTVDAARAKFGDVQPGGYVGDTLGFASVMRKGTIYTDQFDTAVQWEDATAVKLAAGGLVTDQSGSGVAISATIVQIPTASMPFLGLSFDAN